MSQDLCQKALVITPAGRDRRDNIPATALADCPETGALDKFVSIQLLSSRTITFWIVGEEESFL